MALVGYACDSSVGQRLEVQLDKLKDCKKIFQERRSGSTAGKRPQLEARLEYVREEDTLVVTRLDRLARSTLHLCQIADELKRASNCASSIRISTRRTRPVDFFLICWERSRSSRPKSAPSDNSTALRKPRKRACSSARRKTFK